MANIPGAQTALPGVFTDVVTQSSGVAVPGGARVVAMIGQGSVDETLVAQAQGGGVDGLNSTYTSSSGADGRHFALQQFPLVSNRTTLFKNGIPLVGFESLIDDNPFSFNYDYRIDPTTGHIELQRSHLKDQGGSFYTPLSTNVGLGVLNSLQLVDNNSPPEIWTIRCVSVQRDPLNQPIAGTAKFLAFGSVSGALLDANGNPIIWVANNNVVSNGVLSFAIQETQVSMVVVSPFREGDAFTVIVDSGVLVRNDSLTANFIPVLNINLPTLTQGMQDVYNYSGVPSLTNNLSLGAQLSYANGASSVIEVMAAPPLPRRTSYILTPAIDGLSDDPDDFQFPLPLGVTPDFNSDIHFFVTNNTTQVEQQLLPNKFTYYLLDTSGQPTTNDFIFDDTPAPGGFSYFYTVKQSFETLATGFDGYIGRNLAFNNKGVFSTPSITFDSTYVGKGLKIIDAANNANQGLFKVTAVSNGRLVVEADGSVFSGTVNFNPTYLSDFTAASSVAFQVVNVLTGLPITGMDGTDGTIVPNVATGTASFTSAFDFGAAGVLPNDGYRLQINGTTSPVQNGLYDITGVAGTTITIKKAIVNESNMRYEVLDGTAVSNYVVVNHNIVPPGYQLRVTLIDTRDADFFDAGWINALASLEPIECDILVPLPNQTISVIFHNALNHCLSMSNIKNKKERVLFIGAIQGLKPANLTGAQPAAVEDIGVLEGIQGDNVTEVLAGNIEDLANYSVPDGFGSTYRCVYFYPDQIVVQAGTENVLIDGFYIAAAAAGFCNADVRIENPLTNKVFSGFTILRNKLFSQLTLEQLALAGVCTLQPVAGGGRVVWGLTTSQSGFPEEQEISIVFIRDRVAKTLRAGFQGFIGTPESVDTGAALNTEAVLILNSLISQGLITAYRDLAVMRDSLDPRQWNISVKVQPTYPINFIYIKVNLGQLPSG